MGTYKQKRSRKPISLRDAQLRLTDCIKELERVILNGEYDAKQIHTKIQATYAMSNAISRLAVLVEKIDHEKRIEELEIKMLENEVNK